MKPTKGTETTFLCNNKNKENRTTKRRIVKPNTYIFVLFAILVLLDHSNNEWQILLSGIDKMFSTKNLLLEKLKHDRGGHE